VGNLKESAPFDQQEAAFAHDETLYLAARGLRASKSMEAKDIVLGRVHLPASSSKCGLITLQGWHLAMGFSKICKLYFV
jgi:hypothetical protein